MADTVICGGAYEALVATEDEATVHVEACAEEETRPDGLEETPFHGTTFATDAVATVHVEACAELDTIPLGLEETLTHVTAFATDAVATVHVEA